jgi:hypothetical protein
MNIIETSGLGKRYSSTWALRKLPARQPVRDLPVDRGRLAARAVSSAHRRHRRRLAGPPPRGLNLVTEAHCRSPRLEVIAQAQLPAACGQGRGDDIHVPQRDRRTRSDLSLNLRSQAEANLPPRRDRDLAIVPQETFAVLHRLGGKRRRVQSIGPLEQVRPHSLRLGTGAGAGTGRCPALPRHPQGFTSVRAAEGRRPLNHTLRSTAPGVTLITDRS